MVPLGSSKGVKALTVHFTIDKEFDKTRIFGMFRHNDPAGLEARSRSMGIPLDFARQVQEAKDFSEVETMLDELVEAKYTERAEIETGRKEYIDLWRAMADVFSTVVTETTGHNWFYDRYICVVSAFHPGLSNWYGNKIAARFDLKPVIKRRILAYEILLSHIFHIMRRYYDRDDVDDWRVWAFSEITTVFILDDPRFSQLWPGKHTQGSYFAGSVYSQLSPLEGELKKLYVDRENFREYLDNSVPALREFQNTHRKKEI